MTGQAMLLWGLGILLSLVGLSGMLLPIFPGAPLLLLGLFCAAWAEDFRYVGLWTLLILAGLTGLSYLVEFFASVFGARRFGGSRRAMAGAAIGGMVGLFFGIQGIVLGPFCGAVLGELSQQRSLEQAGRVGIGTVVGMALGAAGKLATGIAMVGIFLVVRLF